MDILRKLLGFWILGILLLVNVAYAGQDPVTVTAAQSLPSTGTVGQTYPFSYNITNNMPVAITGAQFSSSASNGTAAIQANTCTSILAPGVTCTWTGNFTPTGTTNTHSATFAVNYWGINVPKVSTMTTGGGPGPEPDTPAFVAVGAETAFVTSPGLVLTSTDGTTWTQRTLPNDVGDLRTVAYNNGRYIAGGTTTAGVGVPVLITSTDGGQTWTDITANLPPEIVTTISKIIYANDQWIAVSFNGQIATSNDGLNWQSVGNIGITTISISSGGNRYLASVFNNANSIFVSDDLQTWGAQFLPQIGAENVQSITNAHFANNQWIAVGRTQNGGGAILRGDANGENWQDAAGSQLAAANAIDFNGGIWIASLAKAGENIVTSPDGLFWTNRNTVGDGADPNVVTHLNQWYLAGGGINTGGTGAFIAYSQTGIDGWEFATLPTNLDPSSDINAIAWDNINP